MTISNFDPFSTMDRMLSVLDKQGVRATFFVLGWTAERFVQYL